MEEAPLLMPMQRIIGGVEIKDDLTRRFFAMRLKEEIDKGVLDGRRIVTDLVIAGGCGAAELQTVQRALARHRRTVGPIRSQLSRQNGHDRVMAKFVMIVEVFIAHGQAKHPLADQGPHIVLDQVLPATIRKTGGEPIDQADGPVRRAQ